MTDKPKPRIPDPETRRRVRENLLAASAGLRAWSEEMQAATDELDCQYDESPIGQLHARQRSLGEAVARED